MEVFALFFRIKYNGAFRSWQFSGYETDKKKIKKFVAEVHEENGLNSARVFSMSDDRAELVSVFDEG